MPPWSPIVTLVLQHVMECCFGLRTWTSWGTVIKSADVEGVHAEALHYCNIIMLSENEKLQIICRRPSVHGRDSWFAAQMRQACGLGTAIFVVSHLASARLSARPTSFGEPNKTVLFAPPLLVTTDG